MTDRCQRFYDAASPGQWVYCDKVTHDAVVFRKGSVCDHMSPDYAPVEWGEDRDEPGTVMLFTSEWITVDDPDALERALRLLNEAELRRRSESARPDAADDQRSETP